MCVASLGLEVLVTTHRASLPKRVIATDERSYTARSKNGVIAINRANPIHSQPSIFNVVILQMAWRRGRSIPRKNPPCAVGIKSAYL